MKNALSMALATASCIAAAAGETRPNILVIMTDDQGYGQLEFNQGRFDSSRLNRKINTERYKCDAVKAAAAARKAMPNISSLAKAGVSFTNAYVASPVCGPSRAAFFTSRYPARYGAYSNPDLYKGVTTKELFLAKKFQASGYRTAMIGKWHLGKNNGERVESKSRDYHDKVRHVCVKEHHPLSRGFDYYYGFNASGAAYYNSPDIFRNYKNVKAPGYLTDNFTNETIKFIAQSKHKPFFAVLAYNAPHIPLEQLAPKKYQRFNTGNSEVDNYYAALAAVDDGIGRIIAQLKKQKMFDNTLIFYFSDNGAVIDSPEPANGHFKGFKGLTFQGGVHIPMLACWPDGLPKAVKYKKNVSSMDILPTGLAAAGIKVPGNLDGKNLLPYLKGKKQGVPHKNLFWAGPRNYHWSDKNTKFWTSYFKWITFKSDVRVNVIKKKGPACWTVLSGKWLLQANADEKKVALFNTEKDVGETTDVSKQHPDIVKRLTNAYALWIKDKTPPQRWDIVQWQRLKNSN
jgi:arylsulfatase